MGTTFSAGEIPPIFSPSGIPPAGTPTFPPAGTPTFPPAGTPTFPPAGTPTFPPAGTPTFPPAGTPPIIGGEGGINFNNGVFWSYVVAVVVLAIIGFIFGAGGSGYYLANYPGYGGYALISIILLFITYLFLIFAGYQADINAKNEEERSLVRTLFGFSLVLSALWFVFIFGFHNILAGFFTALLLAALNIGIIIYFTTINANAGWLFFPYLLWSLSILFMSGCYTNTARYQNNYLQNTL